MAGVAKVSKSATSGDAKGGLPHLRVLFPLDGSEESYLCLEKSFSFMPSSNVEATILVVLQDFAGAPEEMIKQFEEDTEDEVFPTEDSALVVLRNATRRLREKGVKLKLKMAKGNVKKEILAEAPHHDLLVMHRRRGKHWIGGATGIARKAACSSLLIRV